MTPQEAEIRIAIIIEEIKKLTEEKAYLESCFSI